MTGELSAYFVALGHLGARIEATDHKGHPVSLDAAVAWTIGEAHRTRAEKARVFFIGNGGSAAIASHMATDWMKNGGFAATAFNDATQQTCLANDLGFEQVFALPISRHARPGDLLIAISSSGNSANILAGVAAARSAGAGVLTLSGFSPDNALRRCGDMNFYVPDHTYGFVEIIHLAICHALLDLAHGWNSKDCKPIYFHNAVESAP
jgi:D-sedoheptulose 7-phosphate isomerase